MKVTKAVIPCAGLGTRFLPFTKAMPKEMIPIVDTPVLQLIIKEVVASGIKDILIINNSSKKAMESHFEDNQSLENLLISRGKEKDAKLVDDIAKMANISFVHQEFPSGSAGAVALAKDFVGNEPFALLFGDDLIYSDIPATKQLIDAYDKYGLTVLGCQEVPLEKINKYSSIAIKEKVGNCCFITDVIEKPSRLMAPSNVAALGRYIVTPEVFDYIEKTPMVSNEVGITDTFRLMTKDGLVMACIYEGRRYDTGNKNSYLEAVVDYSLRNDEVNKEFKEFLIRTVKNFEC